MNIRGKFKSVERKINDLGFILKYKSDLVLQFERENQHFNYITLKVIEEMNELQQVLMWQLTKKDKNKNYIREKVLEELADVLMTFENLKLIYNISDEKIQDQIKYKEAGGNHEK